MTDEPRRPARSPDVIQPPSTEPSNEPDHLTNSAELELNAKQQVAYQRRQYVGHLLADLDLVRREKTTLETYLRRLRTLEADYARLMYASRWRVYLATVSGAAALVGSGLISTYPKASGSIWFGIGWGLVLLVAVLQVGAAVIKGTARPQDDERNST